MAVYTNIIIYELKRPILYNSITPNTNIILKPLNKQGYLHNV